MSTEGVEVTLHAFYISALGADEWSASRFGRFRCSRKEPIVPMGGLQGRFGLWWEQVSQRLYRGRSSTAVIRTAEELNHWSLRWDGNVAWMGETTLRRWLWK